MQAIEGDQDARVLQCLVVFHHGGHALGIELDLWRRGLVTLGNHQHHESHGGSCSVSMTWPSFRGARSANPESRAVTSGFRAHRCAMPRNGDLVLLLPGLRAKASFLLAQL